MSERIKKLKKLKGRSLDELRVRGAQSLAALAERRGWSQQARVPSDAEFFRLLDLAGAAQMAEDLLAHFRARACFFAAFAERAATVRAWHAHFGGAHEQALIARAERILAGRFDLLGLSDLSFGAPIDWHLEPVSGKRAPLVHWSRINYLDASVAGDKKITWELNRHQHFTTLGRAYWLTNDERYSETFVAHINSWMDANPPKLGINWASSLEVSFRAISWLWALHFFKDSPRLTPQLFWRALKFLYLHARHLETYLSTYFSPNTHLTGEALGLFYLGTLLPELRAAARWRATGRGVLTAQLARHVRADGVYFEQSSYYHRYTTDFYTHFLLLARAHGEELAESVAATLVALLDHLMHITRPDGTTPLFGDDDGGRLVQLEELRAPDDFRAALSTGAALFARPDYKFVAGEPSEETLWLLGPAGLEAFDRLDAQTPALSSAAFTAGGYYVMRDGWTRDANYMLIDCGPHGADNCGHAHADALSFDLAARGRTLVVDPGTYTYTGSGKLRDEFRSSAAHNTLTIDDESSSVPAGAFQWQHIARATARRWLSRPRFDYFEGAHDGYARLNGHEQYTRAILFLKHDYWIIRDRINATGAHRYALNFHFAPGVEAQDAEALRVSADGADVLTLFAFDHAGAWRMEEGWVSRCYGARERAAVARFTTQGAGAQEFVTFMLPQGVAEGARARRRATTSGDGYELQSSAGLDVLLIGDGCAIADERLTSDFEWTWARFERGGAFVEAVLIAGSNFALDEQAIIANHEPVNYAIIKRDGEEFVVETDAGQRRIAVSDNYANVSS